MVGAAAWRRAMTGVVDVGSEMNMREYRNAHHHAVLCPNDSLFFISLAALFIASLWILILVMATNY